ncbi:hypothetical protein [Streptococcus pneumoniae]|uniref:hypothetical protein n=1 Tax=Streptococcus pneumoniae TaxID=1313 RepID=UPI001156210D|nr:hypothetical protein [Streptococcus pneumoniae]
MKIKEQTRKLAACCSKHCETDEVSSKHVFEVADRTDEVSSKNRFEVAKLTKSAQNMFLRWQMKLTKSATIPTARRR